MIDDYVRRDLSQPEMEAFEANYLQTESRREKVASAASLWRVANEQQTKVLATGPNRSKSLFEILTAWKVIVGFAVILIGYGLVYVVLMSGKVSVQFGGKTEGPIEPLISIGKTQEPEPGTNVITTAAVDNANDHVVTVKIPTPNSNRPASTGIRSSGIATFSLTPGSLRDEDEQSIKIAANTTTVDLRLTAKKDAPKYPAYSATLKTADGETILSEPNVRSVHLSVPANKLRSVPKVVSLHLSVPANKLQNRTYIVFLEGLTAAGTSEPVAEYTFRVRR